MVTRMKVKVYYYKNHDYFLDTYGDEGTERYRNVTFPLRDEECHVTDLNDHVLIQELEIPEQIRDREPLAIAEYVFMVMNTEMNPLITPDGQNKVRASRTHTSMSVGDIVEIDGAYHYCASFGFNEISI
jgi:hypothetical protein